MLVLTRRVNENLIIGDDIVITVLENQGQQVRIGIEAPKAIKIYRQELYDRIQADMGNHVDKEEEKN